MQHSEVNVNGGGASEMRKRSENSWTRKQIQPNGGVEWAYSFVDQEITDGTNQGSRSVTVTNHRHHHSERAAEYLFGTWSAEPGQLAWS